MKHLDPAADSEPDVSLPLVSLADLHARLQPYTRDGVVEQRIDLVSPLAADLPLVSLDLTDAGHLAARICELIAAANADGPQTPHPVSPDGGGAIPIPAAGGAR